MLRGVLFCAFLIFSHLWPQSLPHVLIVVSNQHFLQHHTLIHIGGVTWCGTPKVAGRAGPALGSLGSRTTEAHCPWNAEWSPCQGPFSGGMVNQGGESWQVSPPCSEVFLTWVQVDRCWWKVSRIQLQLNSLTIVVISYMTIPAVKKSTLAAHGSSMLFFMYPWLEKSAELTFQSLLASALVPLVHSKGTQKETGGFMKNKMTPWESLHLQVSTVGFWWPPPPLRA